MEETRPDIYRLIVHITEVEKWARKFFELFPDADQEVVTLAVYLHDISQYCCGDEDHAVASEKMAKEFLIKNKYDSSKSKQVLYCIRSHRCKDVLPQTLEAKIMAGLDSASHFTYNPYLSMAIEGKIQQAREKLERDYRDLEMFPEIKKLATPLYADWHKLLDDYEKLGI